MFQLALLIFLIFPKTYAETEDEAKSHKFASVLANMNYRQEFKAFCERKFEPVVNPYQIGRIELEGMTPEFFFRNYDDNGTEVLVPGRHNTKGAGVFKYGHNSGGMEVVSRHFATDAVPILGLHSNDKLISFPSVSNAVDTNPEALGLRIFDFSEKQVINDPRTFTHRIPTSGVYQSFGVLEKKDNSTRIKVLSDTMFSTEVTDKPLHGLSVSELTITGAGKNRTIVTDKTSNICAGKILQLPILSRDGTKLIATEYIEAQQKVVTRLYDIKNNKCENPLSFNFVAAKGSISFDNRYIAFSLPRSQLKLDKNISKLKPKYAEGNLLFDVVVVDTKTGKSEVVTTGDNITSLFPSFNQDGTLNVLQTEFQTRDPKSFISRIDPKMSSSIAKIKAGHQSDILCNQAPPIPQASLSNLNDILRESCGYNVSHHFVDVVFSKLNRKECKDFVTILKSNPELREVLEPPALAGKPHLLKLFSKELTLTTFDDMSAACDLK